MLNYSLFICYSTPNYSKLTNIFLDSLKNINVKHIEHLIETPILNLLNESGFQSDLWYYCVYNKIKHLVNILSIYDTFSNIKYFIFSDCDIIYLQNNIDEWNNLEYYINNDNKDIYFMRENISDDVNSGFFIIKNNENIEKIINFFTEVLQIFNITNKNKMPFGDQTIINNLKNKINYGFIPYDYIIFGKHIFNKNKSLLHHAIGCKNIDEKINQINNINNYFLLK
jgi:hypothetical protein